MSRITDRQLARKLRPETTPEPPAGLLEELRRQIPAQIEAPAPPPAGSLLPFRRPLSRRVWLAAASVAMLIGGGTFSWVALRNHVGLTTMEEPRPHFSREDSYMAQAAPSPAEARGGSAGAMQPRDLRALGYAGADPSAAAPAPVPAYPGRFGADGDQSREAQNAVAAPQVMAPARPLALPMEVASAPEPEARRDAAVEEVITTTGERGLLDERRIASGAAVAQAELAEVPASRGPQRQRAGEVGGREAGQQATTQRGSSPRLEAATDAFAKAEKAAKSSEPTSAPPPAAPAPPPSTGGTAEPNDRPSGGVLFRSYGGDPFVDSEKDPLSTFALAVDTGSYDVVRRYLADGRLPPAEAVRVEELVNAFDYGDAAPSSGDPALIAEGAPDPWAPDDRYVLVRFGLATRAVAAEARAQVELDARYVARWRLLGYEDRDVADRRFRDAGFGGGEIGAGQTVSALYELELRPQVPADATLAVLRVRWKPAGGGDSREPERLLRRRDLAGSWERAGRAFRLATVVGRFAEVLRGSYWAQGDDLSELARRAAAVSEDWPRQERVAELVRLIERARDLRRQSGAGS